MQSGAVQSGEEREKRQRRRGKEGGRRWRQRKERNFGGKEQWREEERRTEKKERGREREKLKVSVRTVWSSELDRDTAAVTSVLISPSAG